MAEPIRLVIVDDHAIVRQGLRSILEREPDVEVVGEAATDVEALDLVAATRDPKAAGLPDLADLIGFGASPRATIYLARAAKAMALLRGRGFVIPEDVKEVAADVLRHRVVPTYEAEAEEVSSDSLVARLLDRVEVP